MMPWLCRYKACYKTGYDFEVKLNPKSWGKN
jgi:hypothetical protein